MMFCIMQFIQEILHTALFVALLVILLYCIFIYAFLYCIWVWHARILMYAYLLIKFVYT